MPLCWFPTWPAWSLWVCGLGEVVKAFPSPEAHTRWARALGLHRYAGALKLALQLHPEAPGAVELRAFSAVMEEERV